MAKHRGEFTDKTIEKRIKEGRGFGEGSSYLPWITIRDVPSQGRCSEIRGWKANRVHQLLSDLETRYFYTLEFSTDIIDIREQYPLLDLNKSIDETVKIAESIGVKYPIVPKTGALNVQTTDFLITIISNGRTEQIARTVKYAKDLSDERTIEKFEIERLYWVNRGVDWKIVTEHDINKDYSFNVELIHNAFTLGGSNFDVSKVMYVENALRNEMLERPKSLAKITQTIDTNLGLLPGDALFCVKHLLANKIWRVDMKQKICTSKVLLINEFKKYPTAN